MPPEKEKFDPHPDKRENKEKELVSTAWIFAGQGTQFVGMGKDFYNESKLARETYDSIDINLDPKFSQISFEGPEDVLNQTTYTQLAVFTHNHVNLQLAQDQNLEGFQRSPIATAGNSLGEYNAFVASGVFSFLDGARLIKERGKALEIACRKNPSGLIALNLLESDERISDFLDQYRLHLSTINPGQIVLGGLNGDLDKFQSHLEKLKIGSTRLNVAGGFHTPLMSAAIEDFSGVVESIEIGEPKVPILGNTTATLLETKEDVRTELVNHLTHTVKWSKIVDALLESGVTQIFEIGNERGILVTRNLRTKGGEIKRGINTQVGTLKIAHWSMEPKESTESL